MEISVYDMPEKCVTFLQRKLEVEVAFQKNVDDFPDLV